MRVVRFNSSTKDLKLVPSSFDDLYLLARIIGAGDVVTASTTRRFRPSEGDEGEQKEVVITLAVEKVEVDKNALKLRLGVDSVYPEPMVSVPPLSVTALPVVPL